MALRIRTVDQDDRPVLDFWRCPMIPLRDPERRTGHADGFEDIPQELGPAALAAAIPAWDLAPLRAQRPGRTRRRPRARRHVFEIEGGETVSGAPELARLTLNLAMAHTDATTSAHGRRLVYGGHTISIAAAHATRALPALATIVAWQQCDHIGPVFEDDVLRTTLHGRRTCSRRGDGRAGVPARAGPGRARRRGLAPVLDWRFVGLLA